MHIHTSSNPRANSTTICKFSFIASCSLADAAPSDGGGGGGGGGSACACAAFEVVVGMVCLVWWYLMCVLNLFFFLFLRQRQGRRGLRGYCKGDDGDKEDLGSWRASGSWSSVYGVVDVNVNEF